MCWQHGIAASALASILAIAGAAPAAADGACVSATASAAVTQSTVLLHKELPSPLFDPLCQLRRYAPH